MRVVAFLFWLFNYLLFLLTLLYLAGFLMNRYTPSTIDSGLQLPEAEAAIRDVGLLALFGVQHSLMARPWWKRLWPAALERSIYLLGTSAILIILFRYWEPIPALVWRVESIAPLFTLLQAMGVVLILWASVVTDHWDKFGLRQVWAYLRRRTYAPVRFQVRGPYRWSRHPMMLGLLLILWATPEASRGRLLFNAVWTAYIFIGIWFEERDLVRHFGKAYEDYRNQVRRIL